MQDVSRRSLLRGGALLAAAVPLSSVLLPTDAAFADRLNRASFAPYTGTRFGLDGSSLTLVSLEDLPNARRGDVNRFSALFEVTAGKSPGQGTRTLTHPKMGRLTLFLVPVGRSGDLQAVFNAA
jgi:hypothetical protein